MRNERVRVLLAAAVCLAAGAAAGKELPRREAEEAKQPSRAEQACAYLGPGYTRAPGSDTCVKVGGSVRFDGAVLWTR